MALDISRQVRVDRNAVFTVNINTVVVVREWMDVMTMVTTEELQTTSKSEFGVGTLVIKMDVGARGDQNARSQNGKAPELLESIMANGDGLERGTGRPHNRIGDMDDGQGGDGIVAGIYTRAHTDRAEI